MTCYNRSHGKKLRFVLHIYFKWTTRTIMEQWWIKWKQWSVAEGK